MSEIVFIHTSPSQSDIINFSIDFNDVPVLHQTLRGIDASHFSPKEMADEILRLLGGEFGFSTVSTNQFIFSRRQTCSIQTIQNVDNENRKRVMTITLSLAVLSDYAMIRYEIGEILDKLQEKTTEVFTVLRDNYSRWNNTKST